MAATAVKTVAQYLATLPPEKRKVVAAVRKLIRANLPKGYVEAIGWGVISYQVPLKRYPDTYNGKPLCVAGLASTKSGYTLHLMCTMMDPILRKAFVTGFAKAGKRLDMGRACVRFKKLEDLPLEVVARAIAAVPVDGFIARYEAVKRK